jgi:hypothetical protein
LPPTKVTKIVTSPRAGVLKISVRKKRPGAALLPVTKGKEARVDVEPP